MAAAVEEVDIAKTLRSSPVTTVHVRYECG
jgi:hypothetical protein